MRITLIGAGNLATHLGKALADAGNTIEQVYSRTMQSATRLAALLGCEAQTEIDNIKALEIAVSAFQTEIDAAIAEGGFDRETYVKLVRNDHDPNGGYYWFVSFIKDKDDYWAALIDSKTGEVVSTRKSVTEEEDTSDTIAV